ncbi:MAG: hypothetical protein ACT4PG_03235 [Panacagrimonas sp.]
MNLVLILLLLNLAALTLLGWRHARLHRELRALEARGAALGGTAAVPEELRRIAREDTPLLSLRILNPMELAAQKHWLAGVAGRITQGIVRRIVAHEAAKMMRVEVLKWGVVAEVQVVGRD